MAGYFIAVRSGGDTGPYIVERRRAVGSLADVGFTSPSRERAEIAAAALNKADRDRWDECDLHVALHEIATESVDVVRRRYA